MDSLKQTVILYHGGCPDGFGGAYAAWKKFGHDASYIALHRGDDFPEGLDGKDLYFVDFVYSKDIMDNFVAVAKTLTALDHHEGVHEVVEAMPTFVYDANRSGATIAWNFFHPDEPVPTLLQHIEDDDLFRFNLPDTRALISYLGVQEFSFTFWDEVACILDDTTRAPELFAKTRIYAEYFELLAKYSVDHAKKVSFEGHECYFATTHPLKPMKSLVGNMLAAKCPPIALVVSAHPKGFGVSIRGNGSVDVSVIAAKYGGNGHPNSSGFLIPTEGPMPWTMIDEDSE